MENQPDGGEISENAFKGVLSFETLSLGLNRAKLEYIEEKNF
jgi:hypothetical protein